MKKILLPTDFSKNAWNAVLYALDLFKNENCTFYLLNAYTPAFYRVDYMLGGPMVSAIPDIGVDISLKGLESTLERIKNDHFNPRHMFEILSAFNTLPDEVNEVCEDKKIDLVIMGTQGATGAKEFFLGSNTVHVIRKATVPVLAVPTGYGFKEIKNVLLPTGYWSKYKSNELRPLLDLVKRFGAALHVLHALEGHDLVKAQSENKEHLKKLLKDIASVIFIDNTDEYMPNIVHDYIDKGNIGLVAMMNRKHSFLERLILKQNVDVVGYHCQIPFLVLPDTSKISK
ncbi:universal stress protein [Allomuricauda taeanensis]|uniref:universal stress protein n=1 Tax=Flagellimonas taeanensis TaxID=1005926 RepID=UPI002E7B2D3F|nr:universal stress protein [Allomuricauda taeanensis]MEE1962745.1 universal stress protein [Allomuricauda taeanensis]